MVGGECRLITIVSVVEESRSTMAAVLMVVVHELANQFIYSLFNYLEQEDIEEQSIDAE